MKKIKEICQLREGATDIKSNQEIEQLEDLSKKDFDIFNFLEKTHFTEGMRKLLSMGFACLAGRSPHNIFHLQQAMGGGKTHLMLAFALLARDKQLREKFCSNIPYSLEFESAVCAYFYGRNEPAHFFWGEIANQLGQSSKFSEFWINGPRPPDEKSWISLLKGDSPVIVLFDELPPYFDSLSCQVSGTGTQADTAQRAFTNLLTGSAKCSRVCIVVSDLTVNYRKGSEMISKSFQALNNSKDELNKYQQSITPVDISEGEIYDILRKRLFQKLPTSDEIEEIAGQYERSLSEAVRAKLLPKGAEYIASEIAKSYPFHPALKHLIALFKENRDFNQTRGLMEFISYLLRSVWEGSDRDIFLIGAQHFDLSISDVRNALQHISKMADVIAKDLWDTGQNAHAQILNRKDNSSTASQIGNILLIASLSDAVNARRGITRGELLEYLVTPGKDLGAFVQSLNALEKSAWYLHRNSADKIYFDRQENLTKRLEDYARKAPDTSIDTLIKETLRDIYKPIRKVAYSRILVLPTLEEISAEVKLGRTLVIYDPESNAREGAIEKFFAESTSKNKLLFLTSAKSFLISVSEKAKFYYATLKAEKDLREKDPLLSELETKKGDAHKDFLSAINSALNQLGVPRHKDNRDLISWVPLTHYSEPHHKNGESIIESILTVHPTKLFLDVASNFDAIRSKAAAVLFHKGTSTMPKNELVRSMDEQCAMYWLPPKGLDDLIRLACEKDLWTDLGSKITKEPPQRRTCVQIVQRESDRDDEGFVHLNVNASHVGESYEVLYAEDGTLSDQSPRLKGSILKTKAMRVEFRVHDLSGKYETGDDEVWEHPPKIRFEYLTPNVGSRRIKVLVVPESQVRYTLNMAEPRNGQLYTEPIEIGEKAGQLHVYAECRGQHCREVERFGPVSGGDNEIDDTKPAIIHAASGLKSISSSAKIHLILDLLTERQASLSEITFVLGQEREAIMLNFIGQAVRGDVIRQSLNFFREHFSNLERKMTLSFKTARFQSGSDAKAFIKLGELNIATGELKNE